MTEAKKSRCRDSSTCESRCKWVAASFLLAVSSLQCVSVGPRSGSRHADFVAEVVPGEVVDGSLARVRVYVNRPQEQAEQVMIWGEFNGTEFPFFENGKGPQGELAYDGLFAIPYDFTEGKWLIDVKVTERDSNFSLKVPIEVKKGDYATEVLKVEEKKIKPPQKVMARIEAEQKEIGEIYRQLTRERGWNGPFPYPLESDITSGYGNRRTYNGQFRSFHNGLDFRAGVGTPIKAPVAGRVALAKDLYFTGFTVILDHGYGLFTIYAHMSSLSVKAGQSVKSGDLLGKSGATGRVSGPHLHWGAVVNRVKFNPGDLTTVLR